MEEKFNSYLKILNARKDECSQKAQELFKEAQEYPDEETRAMLNDMAAMWLQKESSIDFAIMSFKETILAS